MNEYIKGLVSVIIPTFGRTETLTRAINSVKNQTYKSIEILVVDDNEPGSEFSQKVKSLIDNLGYENLQLVTQIKHINGAAARNAGLRMAKGEFIAFLDDDDLFLPEKIKKQVLLLEKLDSSFGGVSSKKIYLKYGAVDGVSECWVTDKNQKFDIISRILNISTCTLLLRHSCLDETGYFDEKLRRNQEVQLLAFFTSKYKVQLLDEFLTVIDCTDTTNRPTSAKIIELKKAYFNSIRPVLSNYSLHTQKVIVAYNMLEVARVLIRERKLIKGVWQFLKCFKYPSVLIYFIKFIVFRIRYRKSLSKIDTMELQKAKDFLRLC